MIIMGKSRQNSFPKETSQLPFPENRDQFTEHIDDWSSGYGEYDEIFSEEEKEFIRNNLQKTSSQLYRIRELDSHYENGKLILDENPSNWKKGDPVLFHGEMKSFSKSEEAVLDFGADTTNPIVIFRTNGTVQNFPLDKYPHGYQYLQETLVPSNNWVVDNVTDVSNIDKYKIRHEIGNTVYFEERPIYIVDISKKR